MRTQIVPAEVSHIEAMQGRFRPADIAELWASSHRTPEACLEGGMALSSLCWTALFDGVPVAMFGVTPMDMLGGTGCPWMVGTVDLDLHAYAIMRHCWVPLNQMRDAFGHLVNFVDARNTKAIRWLKHLGFAFDEAKPHGLDGLPFHRFEMEGSHV